MSKEHLSHHNPEHKGESLDLGHEIEKNRQLLEKAAEHAESGETKDVEHLQHQAAEKAISGQEVTVGEHEQPKHDSPIGTQRELKADAYKRGLQKIRKDLPAADRAFSKVIHQPAVEKISEIGAKTVARPSGILGGGIVSLLGSGSLLYMAKHYGFRYNFFVFFLLFISGFVVGMVLELVIRLVMPHRRHRV